MKHRITSRNFLTQKKKIILRKICEMKQSNDQKREIDKKINKIKLVSARKMKRYFVVFANASGAGGIGTKGLELAKLTDTPDIFYPRRPCCLPLGPCNMKCLGLLLN